MVNVETKNYKEIEHNFEDHNVSPLVWKKYRISDLGKVVTGRTPPSSKPQCFGDKYPFITPSDMDGRKKADVTVRFLSDDGANLLKNNLVPTECVSVSCIGWQMGKSIMTSRPSFTNQQLNTIIPNDKVDAHFLYYSLSTRKKELLSLGATTGVRTPILNKSAFSNLEVSLPDIVEQRKIAAILSAYDDLIENNTRRIKILEEMAQALYREWFVKFRFPGHEKVKMVESELGMVPEGWEVRRLGDVVELAYGKGLKADKRKGGMVPVYGSGGIVGYHNEYLTKGPGIIVGRKGNVGSVFWSDVDLFPIDTVYFVKSKLSLHYIYYNFQRQNFINNDAAVPGLNRNQAYSLPFLLPDYNVLLMFENFVNDIFCNIKNLKTKNTNLRGTRDLLLPKLISGEMSVEDLIYRVKT